MATAEVAAAAEDGFQPDPSRVAQLRLLSIACSFSVLLLGVAVLVGWRLDVPELRSISPGLPTMKANAAAAFVLLALAISLAGESRMPRLTAVLGFAVATIGLATSFEYLFNVDLGIDELVFSDPVSPAEGVPGRMGPNAAASFVALGLAIPLVRTRLWRWSRVLAVFVLFVALGALLGYLFGVSSLYRISALSSMAAPTAIGFLLASIAVLLLRPENLPLLSTTGAGAVTWRRVVPVAGVSIIVFARLGLAGVEAQHYDPALGISLIALSTVALVSALVWVVARSLERIDRQRLSAVEQLRALNADLELRIEMRTAELVTSEERYRSLADTASDAIISADESGQIFYANDAAHALLRHEPGTLAGQPLTVLIPERFHDAHLAGFKAYLEGRPPTVIGRVVELFARRADGTEVPIELSLGAWRGPESQNFTAILRDISARKDVEAAEHKRAEQDALVATGVQVISLAPDLPSAIHAFAESVAPAVGAERVSLALHDSGDVFRIAGSGGPAGWRMGVGETIEVKGASTWSRFRAGLPVVVEDTAETSDEPVNRILLQRGIRSYVSVPIVAGGEVTALLSFSSSRPGMINVDELPLLLSLVRQSTGALNTLMLLDLEREATERLRQLDELKNDFVGMVAHELRSPMTVIGGFAERLRLDDEKMTHEERSQILERIIANIGRLTDLVSDVLEVARIESGAFAYEIAPFDLGRLAERTCEEMTVGQPTRRCEVNVSATNPIGLGDEARYWRVLTNLISNAFKFSPPDRPVVVEVADSGEMLTVAVTDHGGGISDEEKPRLFQKFSRITQHGPGPKAPGTGLGLYICRQLVENQGGRLSVESSLGEGSTFKFTVPKASPTS